MSFRNTRDKYHSKPNKKYNHRRTKVWLKSNQLFAPLATDPNTKSKSKIPEKNKNRKTKVSALFKNLKSIKEKTKKIINEIIIQIICLEKKLPTFSDSEKDFIVTNPKDKSGIRKKTKSQSILFNTVSAITLT